MWGKSRCSHCCETCQGDELPAFHLTLLPVGVTYITSLARQLPNRRQAGSKWGQSDLLELLPHSPSSGTKASEDACRSFQGYNHDQLWRWFPVQNLDHTKLLDRSELGEWAKYIAPTTPAWGAMWR
jgi:hypothetical protein